MEVPRFVARDTLLGTFLRLDRDVRYCGRAPQTVYMALEGQAPVKVERTANGFRVPPDLQGAILVVTLPDDAFLGAHVPNGLEMVLPFYDNNGCVVSIPVEGARSYADLCAHARRATACPTAVPVFMKRSHAYGVCVPAGNHDTNTALPHGRPPVRGLLVAIGAELDKLPGVFHNTRVYQYLRARADGVGSLHTAGVRRAAYLLELHASGDDTARLVALMRDALDVLTDEVPAEMAPAAPMPYRRAGEVFAALRV